MNIPIANIVHNIILIKRVVVKPELVKRVNVVDAIELLVKGPGADKLAVDVNASTTAHALPERHELSVALIRHGPEALLCRGCREWLIGVL